MVRQRLSWLPISFAVALACTPKADDDDDGNLPVDSGQPDPDAGVDAGGDVDAGVDFTRDPSCTQGSWIVLVNGRITDGAGAGVEAKAQVCIRLSPTNFQRCLRPVDSDSNGDFSVLVPMEARCVQSMVMRAIAPLSTKSASYCHVDTPDQPELTITDAVAIHETDAPTDLPPAGQMDQARTVTFAGGLEVEVTPDQFFGEYSELRSKKIGPADPIPCFLGAGHGFDGLFTFLPEQDVMDDGFPVRIPNDTGLAANSVVDLYVLGGLFCTLPGSSEQLEEGLWQQYGTATVDATGAYIEGGNIPCFNWFGYKAQ